VIALSEKQLFKYFTHGNILYCSSPLLYSWLFIGVLSDKILEPHAKIPPHTGKFNSMMRYHLALLVPIGQD